MNINLDPAGFGARNGGIGDDSLVEIFVALVFGPRSVTDAINPHGPKCVGRGRMANKKEGTRHHRGN
jgi:hypothetical protein